MVLNALVLVYLALLLLRPNEFVPALQHVAILQALLLACVFLWVFSRRRTMRYPQFTLAVWFVVAAMLSVGFAGWWGGVIPALAYLAPIVILFVLIATVANELSMLRKIMAVATLCSCVMVLHGYLQLKNGIGWTGLESAQGRITYAGIFSDPNDLGQLFVVCTAFCIYFMRGAKALAKILLFAATGWLCYGIYLTDSRGTMLAILPILAIEGARRYGKVAVGILGFVACVVLAATTRFGQMNAGEESAAQRVDSWYQGTQMFFEHPIVGVGMGNYTEHWYLTAHNSIVLAMAELGLLGFVPWIGILWFTVKMLRWLLREEHVAADPAITTIATIQAEREAAIALTAASLGFAISSFFLSQSYKHLLFITVALVVARYLHASSIFADAPKMGVSRDLPKIFAVSMSSIIAIWLVVRGLI